MADEQHVLTSLAVTRNELTGAAEPAPDKPQPRLLVSCRASEQSRLCTSLVATAPASAHHTDTPETLAHMFKSANCRQHRTLAATQPYI